MNIPPELTSRPQWVTWKAERGTKVPYSAHTGAHASSTDPATWSDFETAVRAAAQRKHSGVGYVFSADDPFAGIDLDDCIDDFGELEPWARDIVSKLNSYTEVSPSRRGVKVWVEGALPASVKTAHVEMYDRARYFTVTGQALAGTPLTIRSVNGYLDDLYRAYRPDEAPPAPTYTTRTADADYLREWAARKLAFAVERVALALEGEKHNTRLDMARLLGGVAAHGLLTDEQIESALYGANLPKTQAQRSERKTIRDGIALGRKTPLDLPPEPEQPVYDADGHACCPKHQRRLTQGKKGGWYCQERDTSEPRGWCDFWWKGAGYVPPKAPAGVDPVTGEIIETWNTPQGGAIRDVTPRPDWLASGVTAAQLYRTDFAPLIWTVESILPEGAAVLAGKPKSRKSWAALGCAAAVVFGGKVFGRLGARKGSVLYLDLESNQRRMKARLFSMVGHDMAHMEDFHIYTDWPRGEAGLQALEQWMAAHPETALIVIDVLADFRRPRDPKEDPYAYDRETVRPINAFAEKHRISVLLVHHTRKAKADDVFDEISGSTGLPSAVATMWILGRAPNGSDETVLAMRGRDLINDEPLALKWDDYLSQFTIIGGAVEALQGAERRSVLRVMADDAEWAPRDVAAELKRPVTNVQQMMKALLADGLIARTGHGKYVRCAGHDQNDQNDQNHKNPQNDQSLHQNDSDLHHPRSESDQNRLNGHDATKPDSDHSDRPLWDDDDAEVY